MNISVIKTGFIQTNTYIIVENGLALIVDPGDEAARLLDIISKSGATPAFVLVTHAHFDHIGAVAAMQKAGAKIYMSETDGNLLIDNDFKLGLDSDEPYIEPFTVDVALNDGDEFSVMGHNFKAILTPGHTPGGMCYIMDETTIFSGDTLFRLSVGRTDLRYGDGEALNASIKKLFTLAGEYDVLPGHNRPTTLDFERKYNPYAR